MFTFGTKIIHVDPFTKVTDYAVLPKADIVLIVLGIASVSVIQVVRHFFREEERQLRTHIRKTVKKECPEAVNRFNTLYGFKPFG